MGLGSVILISLQTPLFSVLYSLGMSEGLKPVTGHPKYKDLSGIGLPEVWTWEL